MRRAMTVVPVVLLLTAVVEIGVFVWVGRQVGFGSAMLLVLAGSLSGVLLLRREGMRAWRGFRAAVEAGRPPGEQVTDGLVGLSAGLLLAVPGLLTGTAGLLLFLPPLRWWGRTRVQRAAERRMSAAAAGGLFGPRRARARWGGPKVSPDVPSQASRPGPAIEGEIVEPGQS